MKIIRWIARILLGVVALVVLYVGIGLRVLGAGDPPSGSRRRR